MVQVAKSDQKSLKMDEVPLLVKPSFADGDESGSCSNLASIMLEVAKGAYLEEVLFGKLNSKERVEITSYIEMAQRLDAEELITHINK